MLEKVSMAKGGDYDVVIADDYILEKIVEEGLATKLDKDKISNWGNINPLYQGQFYDEKDEYTVPYGAGIPLIVYDPEEVDLDIKGYSDLWDPSLEDSIALIGNYRVINGITLLTMGKSMHRTSPHGQGFRKRLTPQALCASSPSRGALGIMVQSVRKGGLAKLYVMPKAPLLAGAVTAGDWGVIHSFAIFPTMVVFCINFIHCSGFVCCSEKTTGVY